MTRQQRNNPLWRTRTWLLATALVGGASLAGPSACTLLSAPATTVQCETDAECSDRGFTGQICGAEGVCVQPPVSVGGGGSGGGGCESNAQCTDAAGVPAICPEPGAECVPLLNQQCSTLISANPDDIRQDSTIVIGAMHPRLINGEESTDLLLIENGIQMALDEFDQFGLGIPLPGGERAKVVVLVCDEDEGPEEIAQHLIGEVGVPAMIGPFYNDQAALQIAVDLAIPNRTMMIMPYVAAVSLAEFNDQGFIWLMQPAQDEQAVAMSDLGPFMLDRIRSTWGIADPDPVKVYAIYENDVAFLPQISIIEDTMTFNTTVAGITNGSVEENRDAGHFKSREWDPSMGVTSSVRDDILNFEPNLIMWFGNRDESFDLMFALEDMWTGSVPLYHLLNDSMRNDFLFPNLQTKIGTYTPNWHRRIFGVWPAPAQIQGDDLEEIYEDFRVRYADKFDGGFSGVLTAPVVYDTMYLLHFGILAGANAPTLNGQAIATGFGSLTSGSLKIRANRDDISDAFTALQVGNAIDFDGTISYYDWNLAEGVNRKATGFWCGYISPAMTGTLENSFITWDPEQGIQGMLGAFCGPYFN